MSEECQPEFIVIIYMYIPIPGDLMLITVRWAFLIARLGSAFHVPS